MEKKFKFGLIDFEEKGVKDCEVVVTIELKESEGKSVFTASGDIWQPDHTDILCGGQCLDTIAEYIKDPKFNEIYRLWKLYHLNDMHAGTPKQEAAVADWVAKGNRYDYYTVCNYLELIDLLVDDGYKYGTSWLYEAIPDDDLNKIKELLSA